LSRNKERAGGAQQKDSQPPPQMMQEEGGGGFSFVVPTEFVELPSQGRFYPEGHPLEGQESIEIRQMTAKEEDLLTSRTLLKKGIALDRLIKNLIVDKKIKPDLLLTGDRNAILIATRVSGYGNVYTTKVTCPNCSAQQEYSFDLNEANVYDGNNVEAGSAVDHEDGTFTTTLPQTKVEITFRLLTGQDEKNLLNQIEHARKKRLEENAVTRQLKQIIVAVNGDESQDLINYAIENIPSGDSRHLRLVYKRVTPDIDLTQFFECNECDHSQQLEVPLTADFFWPDR